MTFGSHISKIESMNGNEKRASEREMRRKKIEKNKWKFLREILFRFQQIIPTWLLMLWYQFIFCDGKWVCMFVCVCIFFFSFLTPSSFIFFSFVFVSVHDIEHTHTLSLTLMSHIYERRKPNRNRILLMLRFYRFFFLSCLYFWK